MQTKGFRFSLDADSGVPFYRQIIQQIEHAVLAGKLVPGDQLPTIRALAIELKINPNTIAKAYGELEIRGILLTQVGRGTYVSDQQSAPEVDERTKILAQKVGKFIHEMEALGVERQELIQLVRQFKEEQHAAE